MKLDSALDNQDELDREKLFLMGMTNTNENVEAKIEMLQTGALEKNRTNFGEALPAKRRQKLDNNEKIRHSKRPES